MLAPCEEGKTSVDLPVADGLQYPPSSIIGHASLTLSFIVNRSWYHVCIRGKKELAGRLLLWLHGLAYHAVQTGLQPVKNTVLKTVKPQSKIG